MRLHDIEVVAKALLQPVVAKRTGGLEGGPVLEREVFLEEERGHLAEASGEAGGGSRGALGVRGGGELGGGVEADVGEASVWVGDGGKVWREVGAGDLAGVRRRRGSRVGERDGGGRPGQPGVGGGGGGGERVVEERGDGLRDAAGRPRGGGGVGGGGDGGDGGGAEGRARRHRRGGGGGVSGWEEAWGDRDLGGAAAKASSGGMSDLVVPRGRGEEREPASVHAFCLPGFLSTPDCSSCFSFDKI